MGINYLPRPVSKLLYANLLFFYLFIAKIFTFRLIPLMEKINNHRSTNQSISIENTVRNQHFNHQQKFQK